MNLQSLLLVIALASLIFTLAYLVLHFMRHKKQPPPVDPSQAKKEDETRILVHDLRAPVVAIKDTASLMISSTLSPEEQKKMLLLVHDQANNLLSQIATILEAAKIDGGNLVLKKLPGNMADIVNEEISLFLSEAKRKNIQLLSEIGNDIPKFSFDGLRITEAINNLISNSLKYTEENGVIRVKVDTDDHYKRTKKDGNLILSVIDTGVGIPPEKMPKLFTKFADINSEASKEAKSISSGLGLYITKKIIDAHGGTIRIESTVGKGTTATIQLPIVQETKQS
jgi:signal transduction histidine kinase